MSQPGGFFIPEKISSAVKPPRIPPPAEGIQVNFCKNPRCANYGVPALDFVSRGRLGPHDQYALSPSKDQWGYKFQLGCQRCLERPPIKSNLGIAEERARLARDLAVRSQPGCPNATCANHSVPAGAGDAYQGFGRTHSGSPRFRCKRCGKTFTVGRPTLRQRAPHKNRTIFLLLMNKSPLRRICEVADIAPPGLYGKIEFLASQCQAFVADRERKLVEGMPTRRLYLATDRQDYVVNWSRETDRRNVVLHAVGTADSETGYVFGMHLNYDESLNIDAMEAEAKASGDLDVRRPFRRYARCWLAADYAESLRFRSAGSQKGRKLHQDIQDAYDEAQERDDIEVFETQDANRRLPTKGVQIHAEYTLYGHIFYLRQLFSGVEKLRFFLDQDAGMRAACLSAFQPEIAARTADAFYVRIAQKLSVPEKRAAIAESRQAFAMARQAHPDLTENAVKLLLIKERMADMAAIGRWRDRWLTHPFPHMSEPRKAVCYLTDYGDYDPDHLAWLYHKATLHPIDNFFMQVRRRLSLLERPFDTPSQRGRVWSGYSPYNPAMIQKVLAIFRVFYNYCLVGQQGKTPAMRLGLAKGKVDLEDVIYFA